MAQIGPKLRAVIRTGAILAYAAPLFAVQALVAGPVFRDYERVPRLLKRGMHKMMGISVVFNHAAADIEKPTLYAVNHMSYLDIVVLGAHIPGAFVAKKDVRKWPVVGLAAAAVNTIFTERRVGTLRRDQRKIVETLNSGRSVILFPEGTTTDGAGLPFKGGLLCTPFKNVSRVKLDQDIPIRPVSMFVTHVDGRSTAQQPELRRIFAWVGGENIAQHFWRLAQTGTMQLEITVHEPFDPRDYPNRRAFVKAVEDKVTRCQS